MGSKVDPTKKAGDPDFSPMMLMRRAPACACTCACCSSGRCAAQLPSERMSPHGAQLLHREHEPIAAEALKRRYDAITEKLLPQARELSASLVAANQHGAVGPGELEILSTLQCWVLQLQIEQDELRLCFTPPDLEPKAQ